MVCNAALPTLFTGSSCYSSHTDLHLFQQPVVDEEGEFPYWTLPHPVIYKLRPCCLDTFVPDTTTLKQMVQQHLQSTCRRMAHFPPRPSSDNPIRLPIVYKVIKQDIPDSGVAYLFRGRKYLLIEDIPHPASKYVPQTTLTEWNMGQLKSLCGLYELIPFDVESVLHSGEEECQDKYQGHFLFSFTRKSEYPYQNQVQKGVKSRVSTSQLSVPLVPIPTTDSSIPSPLSHPSSSQPATKKPLYPCNCQKIRMKQNVHRELFLHHFSNFLRLIKMRKRLLMQGLACSVQDIPEEDDLLYYLIQTKVKQVLLQNRPATVVSSSNTDLSSTVGETSLSSSRPPPSALSRTASQVRLDESMPDLSECPLFQSEPQLASQPSPPEKDSQFLSMRRWIANEKDAQAILTELHLMNPAYY